MSLPTVLSKVCYQQTWQNIRYYLRCKKPNVVGIASAFVSAKGIDEVAQYFKKIGVKQCCLLAGLDHFITQPGALEAAIRKKWNLRIIKGIDGIFHPKLIVCGSRFGKFNSIRNPILFYVGSANFTMGGLRDNIECGFIGIEKDHAYLAAKAFSYYWRLGTKINKNILNEYTTKYRAKNANRSIKEISRNIDFKLKLPKSFSELERNEEPRIPAFNPIYAKAVWAEMRSFTGEYAFQLEFPKKSGQILYRLIKGIRNYKDKKITVHCIDNEIRHMTYRWYADNSMFRLNIPNDTPGVEWARQHRRGLGLITYEPQNKYGISLKILRPGNEMNDIIERSFILDSWGKTSTRKFGWY